ncbi:TetR/AcrR family transcriptional regulator [Microlunatus soli]|uniref:DNA-binding transcriptional regulator, AcrR family n=1 Tax=Microlunatus soli TaxID=630515 RepID=A0A1H1YU71_9ACTN|nr:TetR/AcrR family transcriptional regulator [Microlunatus soli]SDT24892.1 DNA-binding transcriptional regulator, AcrR family [Microlunatus soli]
MIASASRIDGRRRRESLLDAALACFGEAGVMATGIEQIRRRAGASPSSVYHHFKGLDDLSAALLLRTFERAIGHITDQVRSTSVAADAVRVLVRSYLEWAFAHPDEARYMYQATAVELSGSRQHDVLLAKAQLYEPLFAQLEEFAVEGTLPPWPGSAIIAVALGPSHDVCRQLLAGGDVDTDWALGELPEVAWRSLGRVAKSG